MRDSESSKPVWEMYICWLLVNVDVPSDKKLLFNIKYWVQFAAGWAGLGWAGPFILQLCWRALLLLLLLEPGGGLKQLEQHFNSLSQDGQARAGTGCWVSTSQFALDCLKQQRGGLGRIHENRTRTYGISRTLIFKYSNVHYFGKDCAIV